MQILSMVLQVVGALGLLLHRELGLCGPATRLIGRKYACAASRSVRHRQLCMGREGVDLAAVCMF